MNIKFFLYAGLLTITSLSSCSDFMDEITSSGNTLTIKVDDAGMGNATKAAYSGYTTTFENGDKIGLFVVKNGTVVTNNACYTYNGSAWTTSTTVEYNDGYTYYAYFPYVTSPYTPDFTQSSVDAVFSNYITDASNKFHVQDQSSKANYQASDLMIALGSKSGTNTVSFALTHKKGLAVFDGEGALDATFSGSNKPYTHSSKQFFLMKPSTSTEFTDDEGTYSLSASSGKYVTHNIANFLTNFTLNVTAPAAFTYAGGTNTYSIQSYKSNTSGTKQKAASWTASFSTDGGSTWSSTAPSWLTAFTASGSGGTSASSYSATVVAQSPSSSGSNVTATSVLRSAAVVSDYDLSTHTVSGASCSMTTANCYLVHAAGTYKLPLVYGNAIKNGVTNKTAYAPSGSSNSDTFLTPFLNHNNSGITDPWLKNNSATPNGAKLIWQDVNGLITNVGISGDYLTFTTASQSTIAEGNAVIAATKDGVVVWSWHIWVTPETFSTLTSIAGSSYTYKVTPVNLGWVNIGNISWTGYEGRSCIVKISQLGGQEKTFVVTQNPSMMVTASRAGVNTYYQWGRKDPEISAAGIESTTDHAAYNSGGSSVAPAYSQTNVAIGTTIQNPLIHYCSISTYGPYSTYQYNLWDANNTTTGQIKTKTVKTIYDPCPAGFCVPTSDLCYVMTGGRTNYNGTWDGHNLGRLWTDRTTYFPASGYRYIDGGSLYNVGSFGILWSASLEDSGSGQELKFDSGNWYWYSDFRGSGIPVRAVLEE